jgi:hypothetical protein
MKKKNKFIASFMNSKHTGMSIYKAKEFKYHTSWNWLMPVVDKINILYKSKQLYIFDDVVKNMRENVADVNREGAYNMVIEFIKLYNNVLIFKDE